METAEKMFMARRMRQYALCLWTSILAHSVVWGNEKWCIVNILKLSEHLLWCIV